MGIVVSHEPQYQGAGRHKVTVGPAFFVRWRRVSISHASGFVTRGRDDVPHGLGLDVVRRDGLHFSLGLRLDRGRHSSVSDDLSGIDNVRNTLRLRAASTWEFEPGWKLGAGWSADVLGRGGGHTWDLGLTRERPLAPRWTWSLGAGVSLADGRYMRSYYGVSAAEAQASGHPVYTPGAGLRDVSVASTVRLELDRHWSAYAGAGIGRLLGPAARSPLTGNSLQWSVSSGVARRF